jgi:hypothetical protein
MTVLESQMGEIRTRVKALLEEAFVWSEERAWGSICGINVEHMGNKPT